MVSRAVFDVDQAQSTLVKQFAPLAGSLLPQGWFGCLVAGLLAAGSGFLLVGSGI